MLNYQRYVLLLTALALSASAVVAQHTTSRPLTSQEESFLRDMVRLVVSVWIVVLGGIAVTHVTLAWWMANDARARREPRAQWAIIGLLLGPVGLLIWLLTRRRRRPLRARS